MSKKEKGGTIKNRTKNIDSEQNLELMHEQKWFHETSRDEINLKSREEEPFIEGRNDSNIYQDIGEEMFRRLAEDILSGRLQNYRSGKDLFMHMLFLTDSEFICCSKELENFNDYVDHRVNQCEKTLPPKPHTPYVSRTAKNTDQYDMSAFITKTLKGKYKDEDFDQKEENIVNRKNDKKHLRCSHKNCRKKFKSINGLKYHIKHGHRNPNEVVKGFKCDIPGCKKKYKNHNGLKYHNEHAHKEITDEK